MAMLKAHERARKLSQTNLRYKYNLGRRRLGLVRRDERRTIG
jgi:hypothetical protein